VACLRPSGRRGDRGLQDYLEKLIQIPYHLPRLSPVEVETYINLLACQQHLHQEKCTVILTHWATKRAANFYAAYQYTAIKEALGSIEAIPGELEQRLIWSNAIAPVLTEGLKGNPRQVKRMLNAMLLRRKLANVAGINIRDEVLAKLMVLEYTYLQRFQEVNKGIRLRRDNWVSVMYAEELNSTKSSVSLQRTDRHGILGQKPADFQVFL